MFIFANTSTQGIIKFNTWIGVWEYNSNIGAIFALPNGLSLIFTHNVGYHIIIQLLFGGTCSPVEATGTFASYMIPKLTRRLPALFAKIYVEQNVSL